MAEAAAVVLDRDGTIIEDEHYLNDEKRVRLIPGAAAALRTIHDKGYLIFVLSNQSGIGRGLISHDQFQAVQTRLCEILREEKVTVDAFLYCFHTPEDECECRKPKAGLVPREFQGKRINWAKSFTIGDKDTDVTLSRALGATGCLVLTGKGQDTLSQWPVNDTALQVYDTVSSFASAIPPFPESH